MSTPPEQPSAYPYPNPHTPGGYGSPPPSQPPGIPGQPGQSPLPPQGQPAQPNPYAQAPTQAGQPGVPNPYAQPMPSPYGPAGVPGQPAPGTGSGGGGGGGRKVLWAVLGAAVASVLWGGGLVGFQLLGSDDEPDLGAYTLKDDLCQSSDISALKEEYPEEDDDPSHDSVKHSALDTMNCSLSLKRTGDSFANAYVTINVDLHKETDPSAEFDAIWQGYEQREGDYKVEAVDGLGDKAYLVTSEPTADRSYAYAYLAVRDGWMTYSMSWSDYGEEDEIPSLSDITPKMRKDTEATLGKLRS
ncbi:hypothetical protein GCM10027168_51670 [Streptomyces capparidis]